MTYLDNSPHGVLETALRYIADVPTGEEPLPDYQEPALEGVLYLKDELERIKRAIVLVAGQLTGPSAQEIRTSIGELLYGSGV